MLYVYFFLWIGPHVCLAIAAVVALSKGIQRRLPFFFLFIVYQVLSFVVAFSCYLWVVERHNGAPAAAMVYHRVHIIQDAGDAVLRLAAVYELAVVTLFSRLSRSELLRRGFHWTAAGLSLTAVALAATLGQSRPAHLVNAIATLNFSVSLIQMGLLFALLFCTKLLGLSWKNISAGIALGFGLQSAVEMAGSALFVRLGRPAYFSTDLMQMGAFQVCAIAWLVYIICAAKDSPIEARARGVSEIEALGQQAQIWRNDFEGG